MQSWLGTGISAAAILVAASAAPALARPVPLPVSVAGSSMPWNYSSTLNKRQQFGNNDGSAPVVVTLAALGASVGQSISIKYVSGTVGPGGPYACADAKGDSAFVTNHNRGNSGNYFPSRFIKKEPTYLIELVAVFTDSAGKIVGKPFVVPDKAAKPVPAGATQIQFGVNDDIFSDNTGGWDIAVAAK